MQNQKNTNTGLVNAQEEQDRAKLIEDLVLNNDISSLTPIQKVSYYRQFCAALGLNPLTQPFKILVFEGKEALYATKDATEQLRKINAVSITDIKTTELRGVIIVTATGHDNNGRSDSATGVVPLEEEEKIWQDGVNGAKGKYIKTGKMIAVIGKDLANAIMKAETKAKRRLTLSLCGLGITDESEIETMQGAQTKTIEEDFLNEEELEVWLAVLKECSTPEEVDRAAMQNKEAIEKNPAIKPLFKKAKEMLRLAREGNRKMTAKERGEQLAKQTEEMLKK